VESGEDDWTEDRLAAVWEGDSVEMIEWMEGVTCLSEWPLCSSVGVGELMGGGEGSDTSR
jgi:hypothetical protein